MSDLRSKVIRLAHQNPELRPHLMPLLKEAAKSTPSDLDYAFFRQNGRLIQPMYEKVEQALELIREVDKINPPQNGELHPATKAALKALLALSGVTGSIHRY